MIELLYRAIAGNGTDHRSLFLRNELRTLLGRANKNLKTLAYFTLLAFIAVVFAEAGWKYLGKRMDNPYVKWIDFPVSSDVDNQYGPIIRDLDSLKSEQQFTMDRHSGFNRYILGFRRADGRLTDKVKGRTFIHPEDNTLLAAILIEQNRVRMNASGSDPGAWNEAHKKRGIIITEELVRMMKFDADQDTLYAEYGKEHYLQLQVIAVVKSLPDRAMFMSSYEMFWDLTRSAGTEFDFYNKYRRTDRLPFLVRMDDAQYDTKKAKIQLDQLVREQGYHLQVTNIAIGQLPVSQGPFNATMTVMLEGEHEMGRTHDLVELITRASSTEYLRPFLQEEYNWHRTGELSGSKDVLVRPGTGDNKYSFVTMHFDQIDSIRPFRKYMLNKFAVDIDLEQIESRENFHLVTVITSILAIALILFALISISLFISNVLRAHLEKIKMNLGTFMAFGLSRQFLVGSYLRMILGMLLAVFLFALLVVGLLDVLDVPYRLLTLFGMSLNQDFTEAFSVLSLSLFMLILLILLLTWWNTRRSVNAVLRHAPSDLIYNRTE